jgi:transcriptional regulator with XRE-family HTH domain/tetratricopeptide (TPR) repeat protein
MGGTTGRDGALGGAILVLRWLDDWTQEELAQRAGLSAGSISYYERGEIVPPREALGKIARAARVTVADIERLADSIHAFSLARESLAGPAQPVDLAVRITSQLSEDFRSRALPIVLTFLALRRKVAPGVSLSPEEARREAHSLWLCLERIGPARLPSLLETLPELLSWAVCERLADESGRAASDDADRALGLAELALWVAERVPGEALRRQCEGYAWAFIGNVRRVCGDLRGADEAFELAHRLWQEGAPGDRGFLAGARLLDLEASLRIGQRRLGDARRLLAQAAAQTEGGLPLARILIKDAYALELSADYHRAVTTLQRAAPLLPETELRLRCVVHFNLLVNLCHLGRAAEAVPLLPELQALAAQIDYGLDQVRLRWLEGRIAAGVGRTGEAIEALARVRADFAEKKIRYDEALAGMELAGLYLEQGRTEEVKRLVRQMAPVFQDQGVHAEARKALALFRRAVELETVTLELVRRLVAYLYQARHDPNLRFAEGD